MGEKDNGGRIMHLQTKKVRLKLSLLGEEDKYYFLCI